MSRRGHQQARSSDNAMRTFQLEYPFVAMSVGVFWVFGCTASVPPVVSPNEDPVPGSIVTVAGTGQAGYGGDGGPAISAGLNHPMDVVMTDDDKLLIADFDNNRIRQIDLSVGTITTLAGTGEVGGEHALNAPSSVTPLGEGRFLVVAWRANQLYEYAPDGARKLVAGTGDGECAGEAPSATPANTSFNFPRNVDVLADGSWLLGEQGCHQVRRLTADAVLTYAGTGAAGYSGDDGQATLAMLRAGSVEDGPSLGISLSPEDPPDELFIADTGNHVIRQVKTFTGRIETFAGTGAPGFVDGPPQLAQFNRPTHVFCTRDHSLWIVDTGNHAVRHVDPLRTRVVTIAGTGTAGYNGDHIPAVQAQLNHPGGVFVSEAGDVFIADTGNHRIRRIASPGS